MSQSCHPLYAITICAAIIYQVPLRHQLKSLLIIGSVLIALGPAGFVYEIKSEGVIHRLIYGFAFFSLESSGHFDMAFMNHVRMTISVLNVLSFIAPVFIIHAASSILASPEHKEQADTPLRIATQMRQLKAVINAGSALLVAGIIHTNAWLQ